MIENDPDGPDNPEGSPPRPALHRDDLPYGVAEELTARIEEAFPGMKVRFAGDVPDGELPPGFKEELESFDGDMRKSFEDGLCFDCGKKIPGWKHGEPLPDGWGFYEVMGKEGSHIFICEECDENTPDVDTDGDGDEDGKGECP